MLKQRVVLPVAVALLALAASRGAAEEAQDAAAASPIPPVQYNHYHPEADMGTIPARLYHAPLPVPHWVGWTYITYPPMAPHHWMHLHSRRYVRNHPDGGMTHDHHLLGLAPPPVGPIRNRVRHGRCARLTEPERNPPCDSSRC